MNYKFEIKISGDGDGIHFSYDGSGKELVVATEIMAAKILANAAKDKRNLDKLRLDMNAIVEVLAADAWTAETAETDKGEERSRSPVQLFCVDAYGITGGNEMKVHIRSPTPKEVRKSEQCRHTFRITVAKCAPCDGYNLNCEHYEKTDKDAADTKHLLR